MTISHSLSGSPCREDSTGVATSAALTSASASAPLSTPPCRVASTVADNSDALLRHGRFFVDVCRARRPARAASRAGHVVQYSRNAFLHRGHGLDGRSTKRRTAATASQPLTIGRAAPSASRSACAASTDRGRAPRSRAQVRQRNSAVSIDNINSDTTSSGGEPRSKLAKAAAAVSPLAFGSRNKEELKVFMLNAFSGLPFRRAFVRRAPARLRARPLEHNSGTNMQAPARRVRIAVRCCF
jgi:hypothetical protein